MSKEIIINNENYEAYESLYAIKSNSIVNYDESLKRESNNANMLAFTSGLSGVVLGITGIGMGAITPMIFSGFFGIVFPITISGVYLYKNKIKNLEYFEYDYPEINTNIKTKELKKELKNFKNKNIILGTVKEQEEKQVDYIRKNIKSMDLKEKYKALKDEIIYIEQLQKRQDDNKEKINLKKYRV